MGGKKTLSVHFLSKSIVMMYNDDSLLYVQRRKTSATTFQEITIEMIERLRSKIEISDMNKVDTYVTLPYERIRTFPLLDMPRFEGVKGNALVQAYELHLENALDLKLDNPIYYFHTYTSENSDENKMTISVVDEKEISVMPEILFEKNFYLVNIELDADSVRKFVLNSSGVKPDQSIVIVHFFFDGEENQVGIYAYKGGFLAAIRFLPLDYYSHKDLKKEIDVVVTDVDGKLDTFDVDKYFIVSTLEEDYEQMVDYFDEGEVLFLQERYPVSKGSLGIPGMLYVPNYDEEDEEESLYEFE